jgi:hypothetical protein
MDRLSSYAQREAETETPEQRQKTEEESIAQLLEKMRIASEKKPVDAEAESAHENGDAPQSSDTQDEESAASSTTAVSIADTEQYQTLRNLQRAGADTRQAAATAHPGYDWITGLARQSCFVSLEDLCCDIF